MKVISMVLVLASILRVGGEAFSADFYGRSVSRGIELGECALALEEAALGFSHLVLAGQALVRYPGSNGREVREHVTYVLGPSSEFEFLSANFVKGRSSFSIHTKALRFSEDTEVKVARRIEVQGSVGRMIKSVKFSETLRSSWFKTPTTTTLTCLDLVDSEIAEK